MKFQPISDSSDEEGGGAQWEEFKKWQANMGMAKTSDVPSTIG